MSHTLAVLRPEPGNAATCARIADVGYRALACPLFETHALPWEVRDPAAYDALILTSANAVRLAGSGLASMRHLPVYAVGSATAEAARAAGLAVTHVGDADALALADAAAAHGIRHALHLAGKAHRLRVGGPVAEIVAVYESRAVNVAPKVAQTLQGTVALVHSPRAGEALAALFDRDSLDRGTTGIAAISDAALAAVGTGWREARAAPGPDDTALVRLACALAD